MRQLWIAAACCCTAVVATGKSTEEFTSTTLDNGGAPFHMRQRHLEEPQSTARKNKRSHKHGDHQTKSYPQKFRNVIFMVPDGCDQAVQTLARWYRRDNHLQLDELATAQITTHMANSVITDSAAAATAFATGHKTTVNFVSVGPRERDLLTMYTNGTENSASTEPFAPLATLLEAAHSIGKATGLVSTSRTTHATPAAFASHVDHRDKEQDIMEQLVFSKVDVVLGGGKAFLLPAPRCSNGVSIGQRTDCQDLQTVLFERGYQFIETNEELRQIRVDQKVFGMFADSHMSPDVDRPLLAPNQPSLADMTRAAINVLSESQKDGFFLLVEGSLVDLAGHNNDVSAKTRCIVIRLQEIFVCLTLTYQHINPGLFNDDRVSSL